MKLIRTIKAILFTIIAVAFLVSITRAEDLGNSLSKQDILDEKERTNQVAVINLEILKLQKMQEKCIYLLILKKWGDKKAFDYCTKDAFMW